jgi:O-antigen ligase
MNLTKAHEQLSKLLWYGLILLLPFTSLPLLVRLAGSDVVGLPSGVVLVGLGAIWYLPWLVKTRRFPRINVPLLTFAVAALLSTLLALLRGVPFVSSGTVAVEGAKSLVTLAVGAGMFLLATQWLRQPGQIQTTLRLLNYTGLVVLLWSVVQVFAHVRSGAFGSWIYQLQEFFSSGRLYGLRVTGLALEPSWYAHQLNMLYLPYWFAASIHGYSAHRRRFLGRISWENGLLLIGLAGLVMTRSRVGYLAFLAMALVFFWQLNQQVSKWLVERMVNRVTIGGVEKEAKGERIRTKQKKLRVAIPVLLILLYGILLIGIAFGVSRVDDRMASLFSVETTRDQWLYHYLGRMDLGPRVSFWLSGWQVFEKFPLFGSGLGGSGFYVWDTIPPYGWTFDEVRRVLWLEGAVPNPKNLWVRLLAETGIVGFACFVTWLIMNANAAIELIKKQSRLLKSLGTMGLMVLVGLIVEGFSVDSFALVYFWLGLGLPAAAYLRMAAPVEQEGKQNTTV